MDEIQFIFQVSGVNREEIFPQISAALEKRLEVRQRQMRPNRGPDLSAMTEEQRKAFEKQQRIKGIIWGVILIAIGLYLLIPNLSQPKGAVLQIVVGAFAAIMGVSNVMKALRKPNQESKPKDRTKFDNAAKEFLDGQEETTKDKKLQIAFFEEELAIITGELEDLEQEAVSYADVEVTVETRDAFLMTHGGRGILLQKKDITVGDVDDFRDFIKTHTKLFETVEEQVDESAEEPTEETEE